MSKLEKESINRQLESSKKYQETIKYFTAILIVIAAIIITYTAFTQMSF